jgi:uncharacterized protein (DUF305 family)
MSHVVAFLAGISLALVLVPNPPPGAGTIATSPRTTSLSEFDRALQAVMLRMASSMCITPGADADRDFARAMIPHHQGAVEMAQLELLYGRDQRLRRLAQGIVVSQSQEIALLHSILADGSTASGPRE